MGGIERVASKRAPRADDSHRRLHLLHGSNLHRRCMGTQQQVLGNIKRVPGVSRGMADWEVQRVEIVIGALDFRALVFRKLAEALKFKREDSRLAGKISVTEVF